MLRITSVFACFTLAVLLTAPLPAQDADPLDSQPLDAQPADVDLDVNQFTDVQVEHMYLPINYLDESLTFDEAKELALKDLWDPKKGGYRPEFLARFTGIFCFNRLGLSTIETITERGLQALNSWIENPGLRVEMGPEALAAMCKDQYDPSRGARSILIGWVENQIASEVAEVILRNPTQEGVIRVGYDTSEKAITTELLPAQARGSA